MNIPEIKAQLEAITYDALHYDTESREHQWRTQGLKVLERDGVLVISSPGHTVLDNSSEEELSEMGEFCGNPCPYIDPRIEAIAKQHGCHWEWKHWGEIALVEN